MKVILPRKLIAFTFLVSFVFSLLFIVGGIENDFYAYLYVGKGVTEGKDMFNDFAENKGPILYLIYAFFYKIFGANHRLGIVIFTGIIDAVVVLVWLAVVIRWLGLKEYWVNTAKKMTFVKYVAVFILLILVKSFTMVFAGAFYSESIGIMWVGLAAAAWLCNKPFSSGMLVTLAALTRQNLAMWILFFIVDTLCSRGGWRQLTKFFLGGISVGLVLIISAVSSGALEAMLHNMIIVGLSYTSALNQSKWATVAGAILKVPQLFLTILLLGWGLALAVKVKLFTRVQWLKIFGVGLVSIVSTLMGGITFPHHFYQLAPLYTIIVISAVNLWHKGYKIAVGGVAIFMVIALLISYTTFVDFGKYYNNFDYEAMDFLNDKLPKKSYYFFTTNTTRYYILLQKSAPTKNYSMYFLSKRYNPVDNYYRDQHFTMSKELQNQTAFVQFGSKLEDLKEGEWYIKTFGEAFGLHKTVDEERNGMLLKVYEVK